ncbi:MAG TPA: hypothetical protein VEF89_26755 [Solirubrobacteraceae bacterium]|nr:hypothetical protein [Solirubrobacteraceae bacterium]
MRPPRQHPAGRAAFAGETPAACRSKPGQRSRERSRDDAFSRASRGASGNGKVAGEGTGTIRVYAGDELEAGINYDATFLHAESRGQTPSGACRVSARSGEAGCWLAVGNVGRFFCFISNLAVHLGRARRSSAR